MKKNSTPNKGRDLRALFNIESAKVYQDYLRSFYGTKCRCKTFEKLATKHGLRKEKDSSTN